MVSVAAALRADKVMIEGAIQEAESMTCGEIVVAIARRAGHYELEAALVAFGFALALFTGAWMLLQGVIFTGWTDMPIPRFGLFWSLLSLALGFFTGLLALKLAPAIRMALWVRRGRAW